jgi:hypothetical protein
LQKNHYRKTKYIINPWWIKDKPKRHENDILHDALRHSPLRQLEGRGFYTHVDNKVFVDIENSMSNTKKTIEKGELIIKSYLEQEDHKK